MKRMLRLAAEEGFDKVAWTTGEQQAQRYDIGAVVNRIESTDTIDYDSKLGVDLVKQVVLFTRDGNAITLRLTPEGIVRASSRYNGHHISDIVGKELGNRIMTETDLVLKEQDLRIGGEGMKGFYDRMLPSFVQKYTKKWGAKVGEVTMPGLKKNNTMHSVDVTPEMRESVMQGQPMFHRVYHGSGAKFDRFDHSFMGTGEGAQAFGWGTYVTEVKGIGRTYAESTSGNIFKSGFGDFYLKKIREGLAEGKSFEEIKQNLLESHAHLYEQVDGNTEMYGEFISDYEKLQSLKEEDLPKRNLYTVEIPDDNGSNYLHWDDPINGEIQERVANGLQSIGFEFEPEMNHLAYSRDGKIAVLNINAKGKDLYAELSEALGGDKAASQFLNDLGFVGISYPAEAMTGGREDGARNYVIFNENDAKITDRVEFLRTANGTVYGWTVNGRIYLTPDGINPNTPVHEYTHLWASAIEQNDPKLWSRIVEAMKQSPVWNEVMSDEAYRDIWNDDNRVASEVLSRLSGNENYRRTMQEAAERENDPTKKFGLIAAWGRVKRALADFWNAIKGLFGADNATPWEQFVNSAIGDFYKGVNPNVQSSPMEGMIGENTVNYTAEEQEIIDRAKADGTYMKAPNGQPTKLTPKQWAQVRTEAFKKWFGDWELAATETPIHKSKGSFTNLAEAEKWAKENLQGQSRVNRYTNEEISIGKKSVSEMLNEKTLKQSHSVNVHLAALQSVLDFIETGIPAEIHADTHGRDFNVMRLYNAVEIEGKVYRVKSTVRKVKQGDKFYTYEIQEMELIEERGANPNREGETPHNGNTSNNSITGAKLLNGVKKTNSNDDILQYSKVVDENGEPMVVYHRTPNEFTVFDAEKIGSSTDAGAFGSGFYLSPADFGTLYGKNLMPLFVNLKNPLILNDANAFEVKEPFFGEDYSWGKQQAESFMAWVKENGHDGVWYENSGRDEIVATSPNQIKSATYNVGTFSNENNDIRFRSVGGNSGYVGYSMSKRAAEAREEGRFPKTDFKKEYDMPQQTLDALVEAGIIDNSEWHHTSKIGNRTTFYGWTDEAFADIYAENKKEIDALAKEVNANIAELEKVERDFLDSWKGYQYPESFDWNAYRRRVHELEDLPYNERMDILRSEFPETAEKEKHDSRQQEFSREIDNRKREQRKRINELFSKNVNYIVSHFNRENTGAAPCVVIKSIDTLEAQLKELGFSDQSIKGSMESFKEGCLAEYNPNEDYVVIYDSNASENKIIGYLWHENAHKEIGKVYTQEEIDNAFNFYFKNNIDKVYESLENYPKSSVPEEALIRAFEEDYQHALDVIDGNDTESREKRMSFIEFFRPIVNNIRYGERENTTGEQQGSKSVRPDNVGELEVRNSETQRETERREERIQKVNSEIISAVNSLAAELNTDVEIVKEGDVRYRTSEEIETEYPNWLDGTTTDSGKHSTQVEGTRKTYKKVADWIEENMGMDVDILDASSGMGYGTADLRERGFNIEDVEPYQSEDRKQNNPATYSSYADIEKQYDYIISNAVLNVIPDDWRAGVLHDMADKLKAGGKIFINTRKAGEEKFIKDKIELDSPQEVLVKRNGKIASYQRFFTPQELKEWINRELGAGYTVEIANERNSGTKGLAAVVVTKNNESPAKGKTSGLGQPISNHKGMADAPMANVTAKIGKNAERANRLNAIISSIEEIGEMGPHEFLHEVVNAMLLNNNVSTDVSRYAKLGGGVTLRLADHYGNASNFKEHKDLTDNFGLVIKLSDKRFKSDDDVDYLEYVYFPDKLIKERQIEIAKGLKAFMETGRYELLPMPDKVNPSGKFRDRNYRDGEGTYTDEEINFANDPVSKVLGKPRGTKKKQREFAALNPNALYFVNFYKSYGAVSKF